MDYPLGRVYDEANLIIERVNNRIITEAQLVQLAASSVISKKTRSGFTKMVKSLNVRTKPIRAMFESND